MRIHGSQVDWSCGPKLWNILRLIIHNNNLPRLLDTIIGGDRLSIEQADILAEILKYRTIHPELDDLANQLIANGTDDLLIERS